MSLDFHEQFFRPPMEERQFIYPGPRQQLFRNLIENYKIFLPDLSLLYAGLNYDSAVKIDYLVIFNNTLEKQPVIMWDAPFLYTNRTIPSYRYAVKKGLYDAFFKECKAHLCIIPQSRFREFIESNLCERLSNDPNSPRYWMKPKMIGSLMRGMSEMSLQYKPAGYRNPNRPKQYF